MRESPARCGRLGRSWLGLGLGLGRLGGELGVRVGVKVRARVRVSKLGGELLHHCRQRLCML